MIRDAAHSIVLYFDVFTWPVTRAELVRFVAPHDPDAVQRAVDELVASGRVEERGGYVFAPGRDRGVAKRLVGARRAERLWPTARRAADVLAHFPYVRAVLVTGGLSKNAVGDDSDIDFLLIVEPGRVWTTKSLLQLWRRALPAGLRDCFCTNYIMGADQLVIDEHNAYTAIELATAVPMRNGDLCRRLLEANRWADAFVPGFDWAVRRAANTPDAPRRPFGRAIEAMLDAGGGDLDRRALALWSRYWDRKYAWLDDRTRAQRFKRRRDIATNHLNDFQGWVMQEWRARLAAAAVPEPGAPGSVA